MIGQKKISMFQILRMMNLRCEVEMGRHAVISLFIGQRQDALVHDSDQHDSRRRFAFFVGRGTCQFDFLTRHVNLFVGLDGQVQMLGGWAIDQALGDWKHPRR